MTKKPSVYDGNSRVSRSEAYKNAWELLPEHLVEAVQRSLAGRCLDVTFRAGGPICKSEAHLPLELARECRRELATVEVGSVRVYFPTNPAFKAAPVKNLKHERARALIVMMKHPNQAVADAIGLSVPTVIQIKKGIKDLPRGHFGRPPIGTREAPASMRQYVVRRGLLALAMRSGLRVPLPESEAAAVAMLAQFMTATRQKTLNRALVLGIALRDLDVIDALANDAA
jgi:hypothetical protein